MWADHVKTDSSAEKTETSAETRAIEVNIALSYVLIVYSYTRPINFHPHQANSSAVFDYNLLQPQ